MSNVTEHLKDNISVYFSLTKTTQYPQTHMADLVWIFCTISTVSHRGTLRRTYMFASANEIHHNEMEDGVSEQEVGEGSLWGDGQKISFVLWVDLDTKTH